MSHLKVFSQVGVKIKVVPFFKIYNFAFMTKVKFQIDFELQKLKSILIQNPNFEELFFKAKFGNNLNTNFAPKIVLNNSR